MLTVEQMVYRTKQVTESIAEHEDFEIVASSHKAGMLVALLSNCSADWSRPGF